MKYNKFAGKPIFLLIILIFSTGTLFPETFIEENFNDLSMWDKLEFPKIKRHSLYTIDDNNKYLVVRSDNSASGIIHRKKIDIYKYPVIEWKWKVDDILENGNALKKKGDDYSIRVYILFKYDKSENKLGDRIKYSAAKMLYGEYPPHSALNYIWANRKHSVRYIENSYSDRSVMIPVNSGIEQAGEWITNRANILYDYRNAFRKEPPRFAYLAVMGDSDNTGEKTSAYLDYIKISE